MTISNKCIRCGQEPRMPARLIGHECHKTQQRAIANERTRRFSARKRADRINPESCNCPNPACTGVYCNYVRQSA